MTAHRATLLLMQAFLDRINNGMGDLTPLMDDIVIDYRKMSGATLAVSRGIVGRSIDVALRHLESDGWFGTKVTLAYVNKYKGQTPSHPDTDAEIARCVAGVGRAQSTYAVHFCNNDNCVLFMQARIQGINSGNGKTKRNVARMAGATAYGLLDSAGIKTIATATGVDDRRDVRTIHRATVKREAARIK